MNWLTRIFGLCFAVLFCGSVFAQGAEPEIPDKAWSGEIIVNYEKESGNTDSEDMGLETKLAYQYSERLELSGYLQAAGEINNDTTTKEEYRFGLRGEYLLTDPNYVFGTYDWKKDRFNAVEEQSTIGGGYGRRLIKTTKHELNAEGGFGFRQTDFADGEDESELVFLLNGDYQWDINDHTVFTQTIKNEFGDENTYSIARSQLKLLITDAISVNLSWQIEHNTEAPAGTDNTDTISRVGIGYTF